MASSVGCRRSTCKMLRCSGYSLWLAVVRLLVALCRDSSVDFHREGREGREGLPKQKPFALAVLRVPRVLRGKKNEGARPGYDGRHGYRTRYGTVTNPAHSQSASVGLTTS